MMTRSNTLSRLLMTAGLLLAGIPVVQAKDTITVGKGSGILWAGFNKSIGIAGYLNDGKSMSPEGYVSLSDSLHECIEASKLTEIAGVLAYEIAPGVGIAPRIHFYSDWPAGPAVGGPGFRGSITGDFTSEGGNATITGLVFPFKETLPLVRAGKTNRQWCFNLYPSDHGGEVLDRTTQRHVQFDGHWVIVADGNQTQQRGIKFPTIYAASFTPDRTGNLYEEWFPAGTTLRISTLECSIDTPRDINFGDVPRNLKEHAELAQQTVPFNIACTQDVDTEDTNIEVRFRALSGLHRDTQTNKLSFGNRNGAYLTGSISGQSPGTCGSTGGVLFDTTPTILGSIGAAETFKPFLNTMTWRLCSGGSNLQQGEIKASAELLVTFN